MEIVFDRVIRRSDQAVLCAFDDKEIWISLSLIRNADYEDEMTLDLPYWLAEKKGLEGFEV